MSLEVYIHLARLEDLRKGLPVNVKVGFASQYDVKLTLDLKKFYVITPNNDTGMFVVKRKTLKNRLKRLFKIK